MRMNNIYTNPRRAYDEQFLAPGGESGEMEEGGGGP